MKNKIILVCFILTVSPVFSQADENRFATSEAESRVLEQPEMVAAPGPPDDGDPKPVPVDGYAVLLFLAGVGIICSTKRRKKEQAR